MNIFIDIETLPRQMRPKEKELFVAIQTGVDAKGKYNDAAQAAALELKELVGIGGVVKDPDKIMDAAREKIDKTGVDANQLLICCIGWAVDNEPAQAIVMPENNEAELLLEFEKKISAVGHMGQVWIGHNILSFDLPALWRRAVKYNAGWLRQSLPHNKFPANVKDTMVMWGATDYRNMTGLKTIAEFLGIQRGADIDGSMIAEYWAAGKYDEIAAYCADDVELCRKVFKEIEGDMPATVEDFGGDEMDGAE